MRSKHEDALPLIMTHGWPGSVIELLETVGPLTDPTAHGVPSRMRSTWSFRPFPGYGFSSEPTELGWWAGRVAQAWPELMRRLGYARYVAQGGDVGAAVTDAMGRLAPEGLIGIHTNLFVPALGGAVPTDTEQERAAAEQIAVFRATGFGYFVEQATRPQTIGYALLDSPVALAAWMLDHDTDSYYKIAGGIRRWRALGQSHPRPHPRQRHAVLADRHRGLGGPLVLGERPGTSAGRRPGAAADDAPVRVHHLPRRDLADAAQLGGEGYPNLVVLQRGRKGRPLRRVEEPQLFSAELRAAFRSLR